MKRITFGATAHCLDRTFPAICFAIFFLTSVASRCAVTPVQFGSTNNFSVGNTPIAIVTADFNQDGNVDLATANSMAGSVTVLFGLGDGTFTNRTDYAVVSNPSALVIDDFNRDQHLDIIASRFSGATALLGDGLGGFSVRALTNQFSGPVLAATDFNGDGYPDLAASGVQVTFGRGDGSFGPATYYDAGLDLGLAAGDLNGDGKPDLISADYSSTQFAVLLNQGTGTFGAATFYPGVNSVYHYCPTLADFDGDGKLDVATITTYGGAVITRLNLGAGLLGQTNHYALHFSGYSLAAGDFNIDGKMDLAGRGGSAVALLLGAGGGSLTSGGRLSAVSSGNGLAVGDFNKDGKPDLALTAWPDAVSVLLNVTRPFLEIVRVSGHVQITWASNLGAGYRLETTTNLLSNNEWQAFPYPPVEFGDKCAVADYSEGNRFYRLRK